MILNFKFVSEISPELAESRVLKLLPASICERVLKLESIASVRDSRGSCRQCYQSPDVAKIIEASVLIHYHGLYFIYGGPCFNFLKSKLYSF